MTKKNLLQYRPEILRLMKIKKKFTEDDLENIYNTFIYEHDSAFKYAYKKYDQTGDYYDGVDLLRDQYEMWIYEVIDPPKAAESFINKTIEFMEECFIGGLT